MNERIEELATQCRIEEYNSVDDLVEFGFDYEKFAELIILECCGEVPLGYAETIKEHFGVE